LDIGLDVNSERVLLPWQDVVQSVRASQFLSSDALPSQADWLDILRKKFLRDSENESDGGKRGKNESDYQQILAELISSDVCVLGEKWALLDSAYESPARGFFDFECRSKLVFESALQESTPPLFPDSRVFEDWWSALSKFRCPKDSSKRQGVHDLQRFEPANARLTFWDYSAQALWLLDFITFCRKIMFEEYDKPRDMRIAGSKRPADSSDPPSKTFRNFFDFVSSEMLNYDAEKKEKIMLNTGTAEVKIYAANAPAATRTLIATKKVNFFDTPTKASLTQSRSSINGDAFAAATSVADVAVTDKDGNAIPYAHFSNLGFYATAASANTTVLPAQTALTSKSVTLQPKGALYGTSDVIVTVQNDAGATAASIAAASNNDAER
jgi:hypothetical protein